MMIPTGTVTFLFTDIEGSTKLWQQHPDSMAVAHERHDAILRAAIASYQGYVFQVIGDAFCAAFHTPGEAIRAALAAQAGLQQEDWGQTPIRVRMGLHTGEAQIQDDGQYRGYLTLSRVQRIMSAGHGGQVLISLATQELVRDYLPLRVELQDWGERRLKDLIRPERIFQLNGPGLAAKFPPLKTLELRPNNLPVQLTSFIGREKEMQELMRLLDGTHLLTLIGAGGAGKTRLSLQLGADLLDQFDDGVWFVDLAPVSTPELVHQTVAAALGVRETAGQSLLQALQNFLRERFALIILDNCEHLMEACARTVDALLRVAPKLKVIATSREALRIPGETVYRVPSLPVPNPNQTHSISSLTQFEAVRLFVDRAVSAVPSFQVNNQNAPAIAQICYRLDGIPLALELAAARIRSLPVEQIAARLDDRFRLLTGGSRVALPRQQTLRALIDWSYDLLSEPERNLWRRLSVFSGGLDLAAAEVVCSGDGLESYEVLDLLTQLAEKSLILAEEQAYESPRYRLLESIRQYGEEKLRAGGEEAAARARHADYFFNLVQKSRADKGTASENQWLALFAFHQDNLRAAFETLLKTAPRSALAMAPGLGKFWQTHGSFAEALDKLERVLQAAGDPPDGLVAGAINLQAMFYMRQADLKKAHATIQAALAIYRRVGDQDGLAGALNVSGIILWNQGEYAASEACLLEALALYQELRDDLGISSSLSNLGNTTWSKGDFAAARRYGEQSLELARARNNLHDLAFALNNVGIAAEAQGDLAAAKQYYEESIAASREVGLKLGVAYALNSLAHLLALMSDQEGARKNLRASLVLFKELGDKRGFAYCFEGLAKCAAGQGTFSRTLRLLAAAESLRAAIQAPLADSELQEVRAEAQYAKSGLSAAEAAAAWADGAALALESALAYALEDE